MRNIKYLHVDYFLLTWYLLSYRKKKEKETTFYALLGPP